MNACHLSCCLKRVFFPTALNVKLLYLASPARIVEVAGSLHFVVFSWIFGRKPLILCWIVSSIFSSTLFTASSILLADPGWILAERSILRIPTVVRQVPIRSTDMATLRHDAFFPGNGDFTPYRAYVENSGTRSGEMLSMPDFVCGRESSSNLNSIYRLVSMFDDPYMNRFITRSLIV